MTVCPQCRNDDNLKLQRKDEVPGWICTKCGTWMLFGALPPKAPTRRGIDRQRTSAGIWPADLVLEEGGKVPEGIVVRSKSGALEGRTTGARRRCTSLGCPGWFIAVTWETGQALQPCSQGWNYDVETNEIRITGGGEISARFVNPEPLGIDPLPESEWPPRANLEKRKGWRPLKVVV